MNDNTDFNIVSGIDGVTVVTSTDFNIDEAIQNRMDLAMREYLAESNRYASVFEPDTAVASTTLAEVARLAVDPQNDIDKTRKIARIVDTYINKNYLLGMVDAAIRTNLNTKYRVVYGKNTDKENDQDTVQEKVKPIVADLFKQIDVRKLIRTSIPNTYNHGNYFFYLESKKNNYKLHVFPLSISRVAPYRIDGEPVLMIDMDSLRTYLEHNLPKRKGGKAYFFEKYESEITKSYPKEIVNAFRKKEKYAVLDYRRTGVMRAGEDGDGASLYGVSQMLRALNDIVVLDGFAAVDDAASKVKAKNILVQLLRKEMLGQTGERQTIREAAFAHKELNRAVKNKICVYTATANVEDVKWIEPKSTLIDTANVALYENRVLTTLGIGFLSHGGTTTSVQANITLKQLMRQINYISQQLEHILEKFIGVILDENRISIDPRPKVRIIDSEQLDNDLKIELAKLLYGTLACSRETVLEILDIDVNDESARRKVENDNRLDEVFRPYMTAYTNSNDADNESGRPADDDSKDPDRQVEDRERNKER